MRATHVVIGNVKKKRIKEILLEFTTKPKFLLLFFTVNFKGKREVNCDFVTSLQTVLLHGYPEGKDELKIILFPSQLASSPLTLIPSSLFILANPCISSCDLAPQIFPAHVTPYHLRP